MAQGFNRYQKSMGLALMFCAFMILPFTAGLVFLTQFSRSDKQISAAPVTVNKCDLNGDSKVDALDYDVAIVGFGKVSPEANNAKIDLDGDGWINSLDLEAVGANTQICTK